MVYHQCVGHHRHVVHRRHPLKILHLVRIHPEIQWKKNMMYCILFHLRSGKIFRMYLFFLWLSDFENIAILWLCVKSISINYWNTISIIAIEKWLIQKKFAKYCNFCIAKSFENWLLFEFLIVKYLILTWWFLLFLFLWFGFMLEFIVGNRM